MQKVGDWCEFYHIHRNICQIDDILCEFDQIHGEICQIVEIFESGIGFSLQGGGINFWQFPQVKKLMPKNDFTEKSFAIKHSSFLCIQ